MIPCLRYIICRCAAPSDIGDLVQNTYLALYQRLRRSGEPVRDPQHYVMRIARNELYHHYGAASMLRNCLPVFSPHDEEESFEAIERELLDVESDPDDQVLCDEIWAFLSHGDPLTFRIFILYFRRIWAFVRLHRLSISMKTRSKAVCTARLSN